jgi:hypothetical protein
MTPMSDEEQRRKRTIWAGGVVLLMQRMARLVELQGDSMKIEDKLTEEDRTQISQITQTQARVSKGLGETIASAPNDDYLYDQMIASVDRFREEVDRAVKIMEQMLRRHR